MPQLIIPCETGKISDGFHTFDELYDHRCHLFSGLMKAHPKISWWSRLHSDGTEWEGWIIAGMELPTGDITYHMPDSIIPLLSPAQEREKGKEWDGHASADVVKRLADWLRA